MILRKRHFRESAGRSRDLAQDRIRFHVLDVGLNERSALLDGLDDLFTRDRLIDEDVLSRSELGCRQNILRDFF
jgi:hypothetical protein